MHNGDGMETAYQNEQAARRMMQDFIEDVETPTGITPEQIAATKRGSCSWDHHQVLSWTRPEEQLTANGVTIEARYLTMHEAILYKNYLQARGVLAHVNPGL